MSESHPFPHWGSHLCLLHPTNNPHFLALEVCTDNLYSTSATARFVLHPWRAHLLLKACFPRIAFVFSLLLEEPSVPRFQDVHVFNVLVCAGLPTNFVGEITGRWNILSDKPLNNFDLGMSSLQPVVEV